jgi:uncharacterized protein (TIGR02246 family)
MTTLILGVLLAVLSSPAPDAPSAPDPAAVLQTQVAAWNRGDLVAFCGVYADDAMFLSPSGITRGKQAVLDRYRKRYPDKAAMGTLALEPIETRPASPRDPAAVSIAARWSLSYPDKPVASGLTLLVLHKVGAHWQIVQDASF